MATDDRDNGDGNESGSGTAGAVKSALTSKELLLPAVLSAAGAVAASKGPDLMRKLTNATEQKGEEEAQELGQRAAEGAKDSLTGGSGGMMGKLAGKALGGGKSGGGSGGKKTRRLPIQRWTDVAVPVDRAYEAWTEFDAYPKFMHRVLSVEQKGDDKVSWQEKIWFSKRQWEGKITDRRKNDRIAWKTTNGMSHKGVVTFHSLGDNLTRVMVDMEFEPTGMMEKMASGMRFVKRAVQADLARFKAYVEMEDAKGIDYRVVQDDEDDKDDKKDDRQRGDDKRSERANNRNGDKSDEDREAERRERESRRQERREATHA
jgi:uncharacterized membrane protein